MYKESALTETSWHLQQTSWHLRNWWTYVNTSSPKSLLTLGFILISHFTSLNKWLKTCIHHQEYHTAGWWWHLPLTQNRATEAGKYLWVWGQPDLHRASATRISSNATQRNPVSTNKKTKQKRVPYREWSHDLKNSNHSTMWTFFKNIFMLCVRLLHVPCTCLLRPEVRRFWAPCEGTKLIVRAVSALIRWAISAARHLNFGTCRTQELSPPPLNHTARL